MEGGKMNMIPTEEDFARAERLDRLRWRNLDRVPERVIEHFGGICPLVTFHLLPQGDDGFRGYVFFEKTKDIAECRNTGIVQAIEEFVYNQLELLGRGKKGDIEIAFEIDSDENVAANFDGDYFLRLR